ncbi:hypothetical protein DEW08_02285 [Azospirillum thermophilum]|uniref:Helicase C-terminal domain-containing protein n=2 Tax=Azospirillum thermophilum TaxID=2202148 RepID=A0A2S2CN00_9PROT|nr:hypothetical protein DEW08_02285 [Azospirillum thermophilum]
MGVLTHHGNTPHGIRLSVEHAMKMRHAKLVVCTSTLAQGVNLPIRYLILSSLRQGSEKISVRDFHNLMGRAGRSGMYTEGSVIFTSPNLYDSRQYRNGNFSKSWTEVLHLLNPEMAEPCISEIQKLVMPIEAKATERQYDLAPDELLTMYSSSSEEALDRVRQICLELGEDDSDKIEEQLADRFKTLSVIESYMTALEEFDSGSVARLLETTFAFMQSSSDERTKLSRIFTWLSSRIADTLTEAEKRRSYGKTLLGISDAMQVEAWVNQHRENLPFIVSYEDMLVAIWPLMQDTMKNKTFIKCVPKADMVVFALEWMAGHTFSQLHESMNRVGVKTKWGKGFRKVTIDQVVEIFEGGIAFDGMLIVNAVAEFLGEEDPSYTIVKGLQKRIKYGLSDDSSISLYEMGFSDRLVAQELSVVTSPHHRRLDVIDVLREKKDQASEILQRYPSYYSGVLATLIGG